MMGLDTIEEIDAAYDEIAARGAGKLIIDLRENGGGAFAVLPLVSHLIAEPYDAGAFVARRWNAAHQKPPSRADVVNVAPWTGWSIKAFWADVQHAALVRVQFAPAAPRFSGPVYVLTSTKTASAAELAADALQGAKRALIVGEKTAGEMLSQTMYDVPGGFQLSLPIADYYSLASGRIEGDGVEPDIAVAADEALAAALAR
jgi:C-terminal processing protease CtpA/Prc